MTAARGLRSAVCGLGLIAVSGARAQGVIPSAARDLLRHSSDSSTVAPPVLGISSLLIMPLDKRLAAFVRRPAHLENRTLQLSAHVFDFWGGAGVFAASGLLYAAGEGLDLPRVREQSISSAYALLGSGLATGALKFAFGRARPFVSADTNPRDFKFGRGLRQEMYRSFPSGHSTAAFAFASAITAEQTDARTRRRTGVWLYTSASLVALTRMYQDKHWASDVLMGAAIGTLAGTIAARHVR
jgi:membrane-associated phospholipid phosphatase